MSKAGSPRWRYLVIRLDGTTGHRGQMQRALEEVAKAHGIEELKLTRYDSPHAIVRVNHLQDRVARAALNGTVAGVPCETILTSGTIKTLTDRLGILHDRGRKT